MIIVAVVVIVVALAWAADAVLRSIAEKRVAAAAQTAASEVTWDPEVRISGGLFLPQLASGRLDTVTLTDDDARYGDVSFSAKAVAHGVPVKEEGIIDQVRLQVSTDADGANSLLGSSADVGSVTLGDGTVTYSQSSRIFGIDISYDVTAAPKMEQGTLLLVPEDVGVTSDLGTIDLTPVVQSILGEDPVRICVARYLPEELRVDDVAVSTDRVRVSGVATDIARDGSSLTTTGSCAE